MLRQSNNQVLKEPSGAPRPIYLAEGSPARITSFGIEMVPSVKPIRILEVERGDFYIKIKKRHNNSGE